jgi:hypothetical protein
MIKKIIMKLFVLIFGIITILACGGGGGGNKDTTAPLAPIISSIKTENSGKITVQGNAEAKSTVRVIFPDASYKEVTAASNKLYHVTSAQPQSSGNVMITATDAAGNKSVATTKVYTAPSQGKTFQLNIQNIDIRKSSDGSGMYPLGKEFEGSVVTVE